MWSSVWTHFTVILFAGLVSSANISVIINPDAVLNEISERFVGVTLDLFLVQEGWAGLNLSNPRVINLARGLAPSFLRMGGTAQDAMTFDPTAPPIKPVSPRPPYTSSFKMNAEAWDTINAFVESVGWHLIFGLNALKRRDSHWNSTNAIELLKYTAEKQYPIYGFELGNEPDIFALTYLKLVTPEQLGKDFFSLRTVLQSIPFFNSTLIIGPDTAKSDIYLDLFLASKENRTVDVATYHHYYFDSRFGSLDMYIDPTRMDSLIGNVHKALGYVRKYAPGKPLWLGETSTASSQGNAGISDRYAAGFMWLDKLGIAAKLGLKAVIRQDDYGGNYGLIQPDTFLPNPDYWLTLLFKRLIGNRVLNVTAPPDNRIRLYAYCAKLNGTYGYQKGSVVLSAINLMTELVTLELPQFKGMTFDLFWLTPSNNNITSEIVNLNGTPLALFKDNTIPPLPPRHVTRLDMPARTFGFVVVPDARIPACV